MKEELAFNLQYYVESRNSMDLLAKFKNLYTRTCEPLQITPIEDELDNLLDRIKMMLRKISID